MNGVSDNAPYQRAVMGGTFDRLHQAHESLLRTAAHMAQEVFVGIISEEYGQEIFPKKELGDLIQPYKVRYSEVKNFISQYCDQVDIDPLYDPYGPAPTDPRADLIVVSYETVDNAYKINQLRRENDLEELDIVIIPWIKVDGEKISSTLLRKQEVGRK